MIATAADTELLTVTGAVRAAAAALRVAGTGTPELDARILACRASGLGRTQLITQSRSVLDPEAAATLRELVARRCNGEPIARILGQREFWGMDFLLTPAALVPRPDSETLVQAALSVIEAGPGRKAPLRIADLGTGSGCLLVALLAELPAAFGVGIDISWEAVRTARENAARNGVGERSAFIAGSWAAAVTGRFDVIVTNPPYIASSELAELDVEVSEYEPRIALDGGSDGLGAYRALLPSAVQSLASDGVFLAEVGAGQAAAVTRLIVGAGLASEQAWRDLSGIDRAVSARKQKRSDTQKALGKTGRTR